MRQLILIWGPVALIHFIAGSAKLFVRTNNLLRFSMAARLGLIHLTLFAVALLCVTYLDGKLVASASDGVVLGIVWGWVLYASQAFRYQYANGELSWFNGIVRRKVAVDQLKNIVLLEDATRVAKIDLFRSDKRMRIRSDLPEIERLVSRMATEYAIPVTRERLPWWSL